MPTKSEINLNESFFVTKIEINRVRVNLFQLGTKEAVSLPEPTGPNIQLTEKLYVPVKDHPEVSFDQTYFNLFKSCNMNRFKPANYINLLACKFQIDLMIALSKINKAISIPVTI